MTAALDPSRRLRAAPRGIRGALLTSTVLALGSVLSGCSAPAEEAAAASTPEQSYLTELREAGAGTVIIPDLEEEEMLEAGQTACDIYDETVEDPTYNTAEEVRTNIDNGFSPLPQLSNHPEGFSDDRIIAAGAVLSVATTHLCPEHQADSEREFKGMSYLESN